jgi:peroxiredoxin
MLVEDGVVKALNVEPEAGKAEVSSADNLIKAL